MFIFDASTLILIAKAELLEPFLASIEVEVAIPPQVERECCGVKRTLDALMIQKALDDSRIRVIAVKNRKLVAKLQADFCLGKGEAEAIALAHTGKGSDLGHRRQKRDQCVQIARYWVHHRYWYFGAKPREGTN